jgi:hypothetical protein
MNNLIGGKNIEFNKIKDIIVKEKIIYKENITNVIKNKKTKIDYLLFSILFNKYFLISKKHLIDFNIFYNNKFIIDSAVNNEEFIKIKENILSKYPYYENENYKPLLNKIYLTKYEILSYNSISDKFIYYIFLINKYLSNNKNIKLLDLSITTGLIEALLFKKINFTVNKYLFNNNYIRIDSRFIYQINKLEKLYKKKINYNNQYKDNLLNLDIIDKILSSNKNSYNLVIINSSRILIKKTIINELDYNDYGHVEILYKLYLGLNLLEDGGSCILDIFSFDYDNRELIKNLLYFLSLFFDIEYKTIIKYNTVDIFLTNFNKEIFNEKKEHLKNILASLEKKGKDDYFLHNSNEKKILSNKFYDIINIFDFKYDEKYNKFFIEIINKIFNIKLQKLIEEKAKEICPKFEKCFTIDKLLELATKTFNNNIQDNVNLLEENGLHVNIVYKNKSIDDKLKAYSYNLNFNRTYTLTNNAMEDFTYIKLSEKLDKQLNHLNKINSDINLIKFYIECRDVEKWYKISTIINIRNYITKYIKEKYNIAVSKAFCKMYDILSQFPIIDLTKSKIKTFHSCEVPGHFINAFNYWIKARNNNIEFDWTGNSLNPFNESNKKKYSALFNDVYGFIKRYKNRWDWGADNTGDISSKKNLLYYENKYKDRQIDIFTSDCGLGANEEFEQEGSLCFLSISQLLLGLLILKIGGTAICKIFIPFTKPLSLSILYIYTIYFEKIHIIKPSSGSLANSEVYIIGINKKYHLSENNKKVLFDVLENIDMDKSLFNNFSDKFIEEIAELSNMFIRLQEEYINRSYFYYDNPKIFEKDKYDYMRDAKEKYAKKWIIDNDFKLIDKPL